MSESDEVRESSPFASPWVIASGLIVIVVVAMGIGLGVGLAMRGSTATQPSNQSGLPTGTPTVLTPSPSASPSLMPSPTPTEGVLGMDYVSQPCYVDEINMLPLGQTPRAARVSTVQDGRSVEVATKAGPFAAMDRTNLSYCYSHTVEGAITAGANFLLHETWDPERREAVAMELAVADEGVEVTSRVVDSARVHAGVYAMEKAHINGYYYEIRDDNNVFVVYTFTLGDDPKVLTMPLRMRWKKDWKVVYPTPDGWGVGELTDEAKSRITPWSVN